MTDGQALKNIGLVIAGMVVIAVICFGVAQSVASSVQPEAVTVETVVETSETEAVE